MPTGELILRGTQAKRITDIGKGIKQISHMLNMTRIHNAISSVSYMRRIISLANDYKERRSAFGKMLSQHDLHINELAKLEKTYRGNLLLLLETMTIL